MISFVENTEIATGRNARIPGHPAQAGDEILIWGTGFGAAAGTSIKQVSVRLGEVDAAVEAVRAVPGYAGTYVIQTRVPEATAVGDAVPVELWVTTPDGKQIRSNTVRVAVVPVSY
jgi:uncharacterized protein (TIGR03437 family)